MLLEDHGLIQNSNMVQALIKYLEKLSQDHMILINPDINGTERLKFIKANKYYSLTLNQIQVE